MTKNIYQRTFVFYFSHIIDYGRKCTSIQTRIQTVDNQWPQVIKSQLHPACYTWNTVWNGRNDDQSCFNKPWRHWLCLVLHRIAAALDLQLERQPLTPAQTGTCARGRLALLGQQCLPYGTVRNWEWSQCLSAQCWSGRAWERAGSDHTQEMKQWGNYRSPPNSPQKNLYGGKLPAPAPAPHWWVDRKFVTIRRVTSSTELKVLAAC